MLATYVSVALVVVGSMMVGRAVFLVLGRHGWTGLEPAVGLAGLIAVAGILARFPGHHKTIALGVGLVGLATLAVLLRERRARRRIDPGDPPPPNAPAPGLTYRDLWAVAACVAVVLVALSLPFLINGRWGIIGLGVNNDLGLHLAWAEWLRTGLGPVPDPGYPIGPHGLVTALAWVPGVDPAQAFTGLVIAIGVITALTALAAVRPRRAAPEGRLVATPEGRATPGEQAPAAPVTPPLGLVSGVLVAALTALCYLAVAYFAQSAFKETGAALFVLAFALFLPWITAGIGRWPALAVITILAGGITFSYSFPGLAWPVAIGGLWALTRPGLWQALHPRRLPSTLWHPFSLAVLAVLAIAAAMLGLTERYGFGEGFSNVAGSDTYGPVSPLEALGLWPEPNYRLAAVGWPALTVPAGLIGIAALATALWGHLRRRLYLLPIALTASAIVYLASLPVSGDYSRAKALMILAPLAMLLIASGLLAGPPRGNPGAAPGSRRGTPGGAGGDPLRLAGRLARPAWI
ncbi:MAG TPA: hypothetical protein VFD37_01555, partial [Solirubrobacterales bacterium]|nr:hypothetical protein [Solirubrobacterales bacterium]